MKYFGGLLEMARSRARNFIVNEKTARIYGTAGVIFILLSVILVGISVYNFSVRHFQCGSYLKIDICRRGKWVGVSIHEFIVAVVTTSHFCINMKPMIANIESNVRKQRNWFRRGIACFQQKSINL